MVKCSDVEASLICVICNEIFNEPVTLICNHTFCYACLLSTEENENEMTRSCPLCKKKYCLPPGGVVNYTLKEIIIKLVGEKKYLKTQKSREKTVLKQTLKSQVISELRSKGFLN